VEGVVMKILLGIILALLISGRIATWKEEREDL
jgi:hypothetical protein